MSLLEDVQYMDKYNRGGACVKFLINNKKIRLYKSWKKEMIQLSNLLEKEDRIKVIIT